MNEDARKIAFTRPRIVRIIQKYLDDLGYTEVENTYFKSNFRWSCG